MLKIRWFEAAVIVLTLVCVLLFLGNYYLTVHSDDIYVATQQGGAYESEKETAGPGTSSEE